MGMSELICTDIDRLVDDWTCYARDRIQAARTLSLEELQDSARMLFLAIADDMDTTQTLEEQEHKATGLRPENSHPIIKHSTEHARHRVAQGFSLPDLISEFRAARASVMRLVGRAGSDAGIGIGELERFNEAVDETLTVSAAFFDGKLNEAREMFLGVLGHDLRNPLGAILNAADMLLMDERLSASSAKASAIVYGSGKRVQALVGDLLDFTSTRLGKGLPVTLTVGDLGATVGHVVEELRARHPSVRISYETRGELHGRWDFARLAQVVANLGGNAIQHGDTGQPIRIRLDGADDEVVLTVHNQSPPIAPDALARIFDPMTRGSQESRKAVRGSMGLGLYICRQVALAHDGSIQVSSDAQGTTFVVRIARHVREHGDALSM